MGDVDEFRATLRMPPDVYEELLELVRPMITYKNTNYRLAISAEERLSITIRYLALGVYDDMYLFLLNPSSYAYSYPLKDRILGHVRKCWVTILYRASKLI